jgi:Leucine-rich repeat (LRR) protein
MKISLNPNTIFEKILKNKINKREGVRYLISIIEKSDNYSARMESLEILHRLQPYDQNIFKIFENCLISDEYDEIRIVSAKIVIDSYLQEGFKCLKWAILNDKSSKLLRTLEKSLCKLKNSQYKTLYQIYLQRLELIAEKLDLVSEEIPFLLDIEFNLSNYNSINWNSTSKLIHDGDIIFQIQDQHVTELSISLRDQIPASINLLKNLINLNLSCNNLTDLPDTISELTNLETLDLSWNDFKIVPDILNDLKLIGKINFQNNLVQK